MQHARACTLLFAPYVNSYKRFRAGSFAPTAIAWAYDNRTAGFRIVGRGPSLRVECRIPGADANPYLAFAATLAAGLDGIAKQHRAAAALRGDAYAAADLPRVPATLPEAIAEFEASALFRDAFGADVVEHLVHFARTEQRKFDETVTTWERRRYLERADESLEAEAHEASNALRSPPQHVRLDLDPRRHLLLRARRRAAGVLASRPATSTPCAAPAPCRSCCRPASPSRARCSICVDALIVSGGGDIDPARVRRRAARDGLLGVRGARRASSSR